ncbi:MAG: alpha/beta hydrolase [Verrucomicrobiae bacterium]|nr:alpha/beta hydrolase [Verrucomicrobiae bacterium]
MRLADWGMDSQKRQAWLKRAARWLVLLGVLYFMWRWFEHSQVYHPYRALEASPAELRREFTDTRFTTDDGVELHGWFFPADTNSLRAHLAFLICHGNAGNISHRLDLCAALLETGAAVFVFDYRGYGRSQGRPGEQGTYRDAQAAHAWLRQRGFSGRNIIAYGESLGGAVATELALRESLGGLVLHGTFTSIPDIGAELFPWLPVRWLTRTQYATCKKLPRVNVPVLVMHSREDEIIGFAHAERNFAVAPDPKLFCELRGGHNDAAWEQAAYREAIENLLKVIEAQSDSL